MGEVSIGGGEKNVLAAYPKEDILYPIRLDGADAVDFRLDVIKWLEAPVRTGDEAGCLTLLVNGAPVCTVPLEVREDADRAGHAYYIEKIAGAWTG